MSQGLTRAFTLIETLLYLALFSILMTGAASGVYALFSADARMQTKAMVDEEGSFLVAKIEWTLESISSIDTPLLDAGGQSMTVQKWDTSLGNPLTLAVSLLGEMTLRRNGVTHTLSNSNVTITCASDCFFRHKPSPMVPESMVVRFTLQATTSEGRLYRRDFSTIHYMHE